MVLWLFLALVYAAWLKTNKKRLVRSLNKKPQPLKRRLAKYGPSLLIFKTGKNAGQGRRARRISWRPTRKLRFVLSIRYFRTNKATRSKLQKQIVAPVYLLPFKELALTRFKTKRRTHKKQLVVKFIPQALTMFLILIGAVSSIYFVVLLGSSKKIVLAAPKTTGIVSKPIQPQKPKILSRSEPTQLHINKIGLDAPLVAVSYRPDGSLQVPGAYDTAGWYKYSPTPGEMGPAIIAGHLDSPSGPAIFWRLNELQPGDIIEIGRTDSTTAKFRVDDVKQYPRDELPMQDIFGNISYSGIRLITCGGVFNTLTRHYNLNTVVFGSLIIQ